MKSLVTPYYYTSRHYYYPILPMNVDPMCVKNGRLGHLHDTIFSLEALKLQIRKIFCPIVGSVSPKSTVKTQGF